MKVLRITSLLFALILLAATLGLAVPSINVNVQEIGEGSNYAMSPVREGRYALWTSAGRYDPGNPQGDVVNLELILGGDVPENSRVIVVLYNFTGQKISDGSYMVPSGGLSAGTPFNVTVTPVPADWVDPSKTEVVVLSSEYNNDASGPIFVNVQKLGLGRYDDRYSNTVIVDGTTVSLDWYTIPLGLMAGNPSFDWNTVYFTDSNGGCLYYWLETTWIDSQGYSHAVFWVNVTDVPANSSKVVYLNYLGSGNPCESYNNPNRVFYFYDDFDDISNWNTRGGVSQPSDGIVSLYSGQWMWAKKRFPTPYHVRMVANLGPDDYNNPYRRWYYNVGFFRIPVTDSLGSFLVPYIDESGMGYGDGTGSRYVWSTFFRSLKGPVIFSVNSADLNNQTLVWNYASTNQGYTVGEWSLLDMIVADDVVAFYQNGTLISSYSGVPLDPTGSVGLGQYGGGPFQVDFLFVRKFVYPEPSVDLGAWFYHLSFTPASPQSSGTFSPGNVNTASIPSLRTKSKAVLGVSGPFGPGLSLDKRAFVFSIPDSSTPIWWDQRNIQSLVLDKNEMGAVLEKLNLTQNSTQS